MKNSLQDKIGILLQYRLTWHIAFWSVFIFFDSLAANLDIFHQPFIYYFTIRTISYMTFTYLLTFIFYPVFVYRSKYFLYIIMGVVLVILLSKSQIMDYTYFKLPGYEHFEMYQVIPFNFFFLAFITALKAGKEYYFRREQLALENQRRIELELEFLKSQISPHFLFNTMNNLYGLSVSKSDLLPPLMLQLSDLLRYSLYETNQTYVPLEKEIQYIKNYIELEKIRIGGRLEVSTKFEEANTDDIKIAPIILIVFVENAFKHSRSLLNEKIKIDFELHIENDWIVFKTVNNFKPKEKDEHSGIGLENVRKRLAHLYPDQYTIEIDTTNNIYTSVIRIKAN